MILNLRLMYLFGSVTRTPPLRSQLGLPVQSGIESTVGTSYSWHILASAPSVAVVRHPDASSGSLRPVFAFAADWGSIQPDGAERNVTFEVLLLSDTDLGSHHLPPTCDPSRPVSATHRDCIRGDCSSTWCLYTVYLLEAKVRRHGQDSEARWCVALSETCVCFDAVWCQAYTLQVRARLFNSVGLDTTVQWTFVECKTTQYAVASGAFLATSTTPKCVSAYVFSPLYGRQATTRSPAKSVHSAATAQGSTSCSRRWTWQTRSLRSRNPALPWWTWSRQTTLLPPRGGGHPKPPMV